jgi:hypothetical protein
MNEINSESKMADVMLRDTLGSLVLQGIIDRARIKALETEISDLKRAASQSGQ